MNSLCFCLAAFQFISVRNPVTISLDLPEDIASSVGHGVPGLKNRADRQSRMNNNNFSFCSALLAARTNSVGLYPGSPSSLSTSQQCDGSKFWTLASSSFPPRPARLRQLALELAADFLHGGRVVRAFRGGAKAAAARLCSRRQQKSFITQQPHRYR